MSINAARRFLPRRSSSAVLCRAVRAGQVSKRKKMIRIVAPIMSAKSVSAIGHTIRYRFADFDIKGWPLSVSVHAIEQEQDHEQEESGERWSPEKLPPPTPDRHEGRLFPPEQS